jgi:hypothetical protein
VAAFVIACSSGTGTSAQVTRARDTATAAIHPTPRLVVPGRFVLAAIGSNTPLPYTEEGYRLNCDQLILGAEMALDTVAWTLRDSVQYRCHPRADEGDSSVTVRDTVEVVSGTFRLSSDTLHFDYYNESAGEYLEVEIGQISSDTLKTGLGLSGSTPRKYVRKSS